MAKIHKSTLTFSRTSLNTESVTAEIYLSSRESTPYFPLETEDTMYKFESIYFFKVLIFKAAEIANNQGKY